MDFAISNQAALTLIAYLDISDHPPRTTSKYYYAHLVIGLRMGTPLENNCKNEVEHASRPRWVPGSERLCREHTMNNKVATTLQNLICKHSGDIDQLNSTIEDFLLAKAQWIGAVSTPKSRNHHNPTIYLRHNYQWFNAVRF